jgi:hypothetical protein
MVARVRPMITYANVMATISVFIALGGASYAAITLPRNSVGTKQLKKGAVTFNKIKPSARTALRGQKGDKGEPGPQGEPAIRLFARIIGKTGAVAYGSGVTGATTPEPGLYFVHFDRSVAGCAVLATAGKTTPGEEGDVTQAGSVATVDVGAPDFTQPEPTPDPSQVRVTTVAGLGGGVEPRSFFIAAFC